ncbi:Fur-regulated basic protein FbpA [Sporolactobacillus sp. CPB3-1]|uniref:Fur-regulated basic protein FbpA n=1 Tax=Sporolactobacillus mangiferae TaxID=2940498 RepID=A0ABT0M8S1_9BACL|nr:Fur-regulated basic protein FbpA [Sporolactobacillus mangiferae]MCL1630664.1 Fur-regulated basic protein FbpA [Sporolactobacillus mangiferae]
MHTINLLRKAVENRKKYLIQVLKKNYVVKESDQLSNWTLSELENEWKNYQKRCEEDIG